MKKEGKTTRNRNCRYNKAYNRMKKKKGQDHESRKNAESIYKIRGKSTKKRPPDFSSGLNIINFE